MSDALDFDSIISEALDADPIVAFRPFPNSPQEQAYRSEADITGYGGAAGGGKSFLLLGTALSDHQNAIVFRRRYTDIDDLVDKGNEILSNAVTFVYGAKRQWTLPDGRTCKLGAVQYPTDLERFRGRGRDFMGFDEVTEFPENWIRFLSGWLRTSDPNQRTRIIMTFNPPTTPEGNWVVRFFAPWLDPQYRGTPAEPGELRWFIRLDDKDVEVETDNPVLIDGVEYKPKSRTFIRALVEDNPALMMTDYRSNLNSLPEPLRSQLLFGDFNLRIEDNPYQVIPTEWIMAAQQRWDNTPPPELVQRAVGVDVARGGIDNTVIVSLRGTYFHEPRIYSGDMTPDGETAAELISREIEVHDTPVAVDVIGVGASVYDHLRRIHPSTIAFNASETAHGTDISGRYGFINKRAEAYWALREALDPTSGENICLPPDRSVLVELTAVRYKVQGGRYKLESKDEIRDRIGRSPDTADAIVMAWYAARKSGGGWSII